MKKRLLLGGIVLASMMALVGCGSSGDSADPIVGTWKSSCSTDEGRSEQGMAVFGADGAFVYREKDYDGIDCSGNPVGESGFLGTYLTGAIVNAADGEPATEMDMHVTGIYRNGAEEEKDKKIFVMYRLRDNNMRLILSQEDESNGRDGSSVDKRENTFDSYSMEYMRQ